MWKRLGELAGKLFQPSPYWQHQGALQNKSVVYNNQNPQNTTNKVNQPMATVGGNNNQQNYGYQNKPATPATPKNNAIDPTPQVSIVNVDNHVPKYNFYMTHEAQAKFNEYARAALAVYPGQSSEIGGIARVKQFGNDWVCIDIKIFEQQANAGYFELDEMAMPRFMQELLRDGRADEIPEWCSLIHSHPPGCEPFLSATDRENIIRLGMGRFAWSIIATANSDVRRMSGSAYAVHYFQDGDVQVLIEKMPVGLVHPDRPAIEAEVKELIKPVARVNKWQGANPPNGTFKPPHQGGFNTSPPKTVKKEEPKFNFDVNAVGIFPKDTVKITLLEDSLDGAEPEAIEVLKQMDGKEFVVEELDKSGFVINNLILLPSEVSLVKSGAEPAKDDAPAATEDAPAEAVSEDDAPAAVATEKGKGKAGSKTTKGAAKTVSKGSTEKASDGTTEPVAQATGSEGDPED